MDKVGAMRKFFTTPRVSSSRGLRFCCPDTRWVAKKVRIAPTLSTRARQKAFDGLAGTSLTGEIDSIAQVTNDLSPCHHHHKPEPKRR